MEVIRNPHQNILLYIGISRPNGRRLKSPANRCEAALNYENRIYVVVPVKKEALKTYQEKRDFSVTSEPEGSEESNDSRIFVVQKHDARNLHYDFRLEVGGVLKSWAVPKGPSMDPRVKRLAIEVEDHPLEYAKFEGVIPEGQYGAGTVVVWDRGSYENLTEKDGQIVPATEALKGGHISFRLEGRKLKGGFALTKTKRGWILVKMKDDSADSSRDVLKEEPESVLSGKTIEEIGKA
jgi:DNA ligase D-like protein (predicted 3'-phosphoesterase)